MFTLLAISVCIFNVPLFVLETPHVQRRWNEWNKYGAQKHTKHLHLKKNIQNNKKKKKKATSEVPWPRYRRLTWSMYGTIRYIDFSDALLIPYIRNKLWSMYVLFFSFQGFPKRKQSIGTSGELIIREDEKLQTQRLNVDSPCTPWM